MVTLSQHSAALAKPGERAHLLLKRLLVSMAAWLGFYLLMQGDNGVFAVTVDRVDTLWIQASALNIPLQLLLTAAAAACARSAERRIVQLGCILASTGVGLAAAHIALSWATA